jgi:uncharacterized protein (TIGR00369 family)
MRNRGQAAPLQQTLAVVREEVHSRCVVCGAWNTRGLHPDFAVTADGSVQADFHCADVLEGYPHILHGGVIASLLDGAMTNCLFAHGLVAVTAELTIRFLRPVATNRTATVRAWLEESRLTLRRLGAELRQDGQLMATATGKLTRQKNSWVSSGSGSLPSA